MPADKSEQFLLLNQLADEFAHRYRQGERPDLQEYIDRHPSLADDIREFFPAMVVMEQVNEDRSAVSEPSAAGPLPLLERLGDFRIIREIGKGGMGVVYEAEQVSLGRHVALKALPRQVLADAKSKRRFEREAKAAAKLHHTNIVPVFGVGEHDGLPYYVMQFIPGLGLDEVLEELQRLQPIKAGSGSIPRLTGGELRVPRKDGSVAAVARSLMTGSFAAPLGPASRTAPGSKEELAPADRANATATEEPGPARLGGPTVETPVAGRLSDTFSLSSSSVVLPGTGRHSGKKTLTYWQSVAQIGVQVANALQYAHGQGIQHRDIKPSNLLLDTTGTVWVTDFGLAKTDDQETLTHTGDVLGTLRYMPPEAFDGKADARGDVYSLGVTLYELLAFRPAFNERERKRLIKQVTTEEPPRLDRLNRAVPRDLVTIVHKAIERDIAHRYPTAGELEADLKRFLDDEPIRARRQTQLERCVRWARRNPGIAVLGGALGAVLVLTTVASLLAAGYFNRLRHSEAQAAQNERDARLKALKALKDADKQREIARQEREVAQEQREVAQRNLYYAQMHLGQQAWREHRGLGHMRELLASWLPQGESLDRRGWEWFYLNSLPYQNVQTFTESGRTGRGGRASTVAWHIASNRLAEGTADGLIRIWDVEKERMTLILKASEPLHSYFGIRWLQWSSDGDKLAAGCKDGAVHVWETSSGRELRVLRGHESPVCSVAFSSDGLRVAAWVQKGAIKIWAADTGQLTAEVVHPGGVNTGAWSPDDKLLACGHGDGTVTVSGTQTGDKIVTLRAHSGPVHGLAWSSDSARLASVSYDFTAKIWDIALEKMVLGPLRHSHEITSIAWEADGQRLATGSIDESIKIWDATTGREALTLRGHTQTVTSLSWGPDGRLASACQDGSVKIWNANRDQGSSVLSGHGVRATAASWSPDGKRLASAGDDGKIRIWNPATREEISPIDAHDKRRVRPQFGLIRALAWSPDGALLASGGLDGAAKVWDSTSRREVFALPTDRGFVWSLAWNSDGTRLAAGSEDGTIRLVEGLSRTPTVRDFKAHQGRARGLAWSPQEDRLASVGLDGLVKVWDPVHGVELARMQGHQGGVFTVAWSPDGKWVASAGNDRFVFVWDAATRRRVSTMQGHNDWVDAVVWSPDGTRLASAAIDNSVRVWDPRTGEEAFVLRGNTGMFHDVSWRSDGSQLAAASSDGHIWIWDATAGFDHDTTPRALPYIDRKLAGQPANNAERLRFAQLAYDHKKFAIAVRLWTEAFASDPKHGDDLQMRHHYRAARAACMAAAGQGRDEPPLDDAVKAKLRGQAIDWLKAELAAWGKLLESDALQDREDLLMQLNGWKHDAGLAVIRDTAAVAKLPLDEQKTLTRLWADVTALLKIGNARHTAFLQEKLAEARKTHPKDSPELAYLLAQLGRALLEQEQWAEAETVLRECLNIREKTVPDSWTTFNTYSSLGGALLGQKKYAEAEPLLLKGYQGMKARDETIPPIGKDRLPEGVERLVQLYKATGKKDEAAKWRQKLHAWNATRKPAKTLP